MRASGREIVRALRCLSEWHEDGVDCTGCPYLLEPVEGLWPGCDGDRVLQDAEDRIEALIAEMGGPTGQKG